MNNFIEFLAFIFIGLIPGVVFTFLFYHQKTKNKDEEIRNLQQKVDGMTANTIEQKMKIEAAESKFKYLEKLTVEQKNDFSETKLKLEKTFQEKENVIVNLNAELATKTNELKNLEQKLSQQKSEIEKVQEKFQTEFKNLANEIFEEKSRKFTDQNRSNISEVLKPLSEKIKDFEKKVEETYDKESKQRFSLKEEVKRLAELNQEVGREASNLVKALKGQAKTQGNWGELILESILEKSGLVKDREYFIQPSYQTSEGKRLQPDVVVSYPGSRHVVIDSKVSLIAYERFSSVENDTEKDQALKDHLLSIKNHINDLGQKNYQDLYQLSSLDFVMLFMPIEPAYLTAIQSDADLWQYAYDRRILLISPTNLIAALKMVSSLWQQEYQNQNVQEIARQSGDLYDKFVGLYNDLEDIGKKIVATQNSYNSAMNKLHDGKGNLIKRVETIRNLGAKTKKNLPEHVVQKALSDDPE